MKKAASVFLKPQKSVIAWFDNKCVAASCGTAEGYSEMHPISTCNASDYKCWWKTKKMNINILIRGGLSPFSPPLLRLWHQTVMWRADHWSLTKHKVSIGLKQSTLVQTTLHIQKQWIWRHYTALSGLLLFYEPNTGLNLIQKSAKFSAEIFRK